MADRNEQEQHSDEYRPFHDPKHPSWYTDASAPVSSDPEPAAQRPEQSASTANPYADQPLAGPYSDGQPQYPLYGEYPVVANTPVRREGERRPGQQYPEQNQSPSSWMSITSMIMGIVGVVTGGTLFFPQLLAVIFGHLGRRREPNARIAALIGLISGYVMLGLWVLLFVLGVVFVLPFL